jgi:hypothetical protein
MAYTAPQPPAPPHTEKPHQDPHGNVYNVHLYREMRLYFPRINARSHEEAAQIVAEKPTDEAETIDDCEGTNLAALVDVRGDEQYNQSRIIDFHTPHNDSQILKKLLDALKDLHDQLECLGMDTSKMPSLTRSKAAIARAEHREVQ